MSIAKGILTIVAIVLVAGGCRKNSSSESAANDSAGTSAGPSASPSSAVAAANSPVDLTPPDTKLIKIDVKVDDRDYTVQAPEGAEAKTSFDGASITKGTDFGFTIESGKRKFAYDRKWWKAGGGFEKPKRFVLDAANEFVIEADHDGDERYFAATVVELPYVDLSVVSSKGGMGVELLSRPNALLAMKCAKTLTLKTPPPSEPAAVLEWLGAKTDKADNGDISVTLPTSATDGAIPVLLKIPHLTGVRIKGRDFGDDAFAPLAQIKDLSDFQYEASISALALPYICKCQNLVSLSLGDSIGAGDIDEPAMAHLADLKKLEKLNLSGSKLDDSGMAALKGLTNLKELSLGLAMEGQDRGGKDRLKIFSVTDAGLENLGGLVNLESLSLPWLDISGEGFKSLGGLTKLQRLVLHDSLVNDKGMPFIGKLSSLQTLDLSRTNVSGDGIKDLSGLASLKELTLTNTAISDDGLQCLTGMNDLETLRLLKTPITDAGLKYAEGLKKLQVLSLSDTKVSDEGLKHLYGLKNLLSVYTDGTVVTEDGKKKLEAARDAN